MFAVQLNRMLWKEYRQQRTLWFVSLGFGVLIQVIIRIAAAALGSGTDGREALIAMWWIPCVPITLFLVASTAMLFALEREERTSDWLLNLSVPPWPILIAKYGFTLVATLGMAFVLWLAAAVLSVGSRFEYGWLANGGDSNGLFVLKVLATGSLFTAGFLLWGTLGSLTSRRVIVAVAAAAGWWLLIVLVPLATLHYWYWFRYGPSLGSLSQDSWRIDRVSNCLIGISVLATVAMNVVLGLRWCRGQYLDATYFDDLNEHWSARLMSLVGWRARTTRVPAVVEHEHSGWRTWQRLVWQERHRESLHIGALLVVCAVGVLLALYSLGDDTSFTFAVIPLIAVLPCAMGLLGFRFDAGGQQLRFLANRGTSPTTIWLAKQVVWLPRAFWIPAACWGVACFAEWAIVPWRGVDWAGLHTVYDPVRHPLFTQSFHERRLSADVFWFALMSYAVGQAAAMLFRRTILAAGASLMVTILLAGWQASAVVRNELPRWWAVGGIAVWLLWLTWWYSRHWLIERRSSFVVKRLVAGLILPPILLLFGLAAFRWLEVPGFGPSPRFLMAILYPREFERRSNVLGEDGHHQLDEIRAAIARASQPTAPELSAIQNHLANTYFNFELLSQIRLSPEFIASLPFDVSREDFERAAAERFWSVNAKPLETLLDFRADGVTASHRAKRLELTQELFAKPQLLLDAGRLSLEKRDAQMAFRCYLLGLWFGRTTASQGSTPYWNAGREQQAEVLQSLVEWSNHESVTRELLLTAIQQTRDELAQFPTLQAASVAEFVQGEESVRLAMEREESPMMRVAQQAAVLLFPHEFARRTREQEQVLFWRWHFYRAMEWPMRTPGANLEYSLKALERAFSSDDIASLNLWTGMRYPGIQSRFGGDIVDSIVGYEAANRATLLALAISLWKKDHDGHLPESLEDLAVYCQIAGRNDPNRVLPSLALNDPCTGGKFGYSAASRTLAESNSDNPVPILSSEGPDAFDPPHNSNGLVMDSVQSVTDKGMQYAFRPLIGGVPIVLMQSRDGQLSLVLPRSPKR